MLINQWPPVRRGRAPPATSTLVKLGGQSEAESQAGLEVAAGELWEAGEHGAVFFVVRSAT